MSHRCHPPKSGFTLIELLVSIAVLSIVLALAVPSFTEFRQRAALQGAADQIVTFWADARFEALRRNRLVKVGFRTTSTGQFCIGASVTATGNDDVACDCFTAGVCNVSAFPANQNDWKQVRVASLPTIGDTDSDDDGVLVIDPKRGSLTQASDAGRVLLQGPPGTNDYRLNIDIDRNGRAVLCEPTAAPSKIPAFTDRRC